MGYEAEKIKVERKIKRLKTIALGFVVAALLGLCLLSRWYPAETWKYYFNLPKTGARQTGEMRVHFLDVGQGDCQIVELPDGKILLIDGGANEESATKVMRFLNALKVETIDYLLITHADNDHCTGLKTVLAYKQVKRAFLPLAETTGTGSYATVYAMIVELGCAWEYFSRSVDLSADGEYPYTLRFLYPYTLQTENPETEHFKNDNESSAVLWLDYLGASVLFTGDAPKTTEDKLIRDDKLELLSEEIQLSETELLKVAHHGGSDSTSQAFVQYLGIKQAVISCAKDNAYGHPSQEVVSALSSVNAEVYRTDTHGHLTWTVSKTGEYAMRALGK